ncbi:hypothetical protein ONS96_001074 [Cadophora gregata f. sp. sojae]|nr:hypothetical protein ONS96_001074 [Cadophora gregata f. sp. sojae]
MKWYHDDISVFARTLGSNESDDYENLCRSTEWSTPSAMAAFSQYLTVDEELQIREQFNSTWIRNNQVMWIGIPYECAQAWAKDHEMATLTMAMGPLMIAEDPLCLESQKSSKGWSKYMKGASAIFAQLILEGERVTVLPPPPPAMFHPSGGTTYQVVEEPILKGEKEGGTVLRIEMVHPAVKGAENFRYQVWPVDETSAWIEKHGTVVQKVQRWRSMKGFAENARSRDASNSAVQDGAIASAERTESVKTTLLSKAQAILEEQTMLKVEKSRKKQEALKQHAAAKAKKALRKEATLQEQAAAKARKEAKKQANLRKQAATKERKR